MLGMFQEHLKNLNSFSCCTKIWCGLLAYRPQKLVVYRLNILLTKLEVNSNLLLTEHEGHTGKYYLLKSCGNMEQVQQGRYKNDQGPIIPQ